MRWLVLLLIALAPLGASAKDASISMMYSNATDGALPFELVRSGSWSASSDARFVKLHLYFDEPVEISAVEIDACEKPPFPQFSVWLNFDEARLAGTDTDEQSYAARVGLEGRTFYARAFPAGTEARSLTWNFERWRGVKLCALRVLDEAGKPYTLRVPELAPGAVQASSTLAPAAAYEVLHLFDSRYEYAWASAGQSTGVQLRFRFDAARSVTRLRIWNGYQRSGTHCLANARPRRLQLSGDGGYSAVVEVADRLGSQVLELPQPFNGRELAIDVADAYPGRDYKDLVISELRFGNADGWFTLDPSPMLQAAARANRAQLARAGLERMLGEGFEEWSEGNTTSYESVLRLRADGSFYLSGIGQTEPGEKPTDDEADTARRYFTLGNYEVKESDAKGLRLRVFGLYYETDAYGDCNGCGRDCNRAYDTARGRIFEEYVRIRVTRPGDPELRVVLENESGGRKLPFRSIELERAVR